MNQDKELRISEIRDNAYFNSLPTIIKESIAASGKTFKNEADLKKFVDNIKNDNI